MKRLLLVVSLVVGFVSGAWAGVNVPYNYSLIESKDYGGYQLRKKRNDELYVVIVDLQKVNVDFGLVDKPGSGNTFKKHYLYTWWNNYATNNTYAMFNGQFFNVKTPSTTPLSFPLRSNYINIVTQVDPGQLKTLKIYNGGKSAQILYNYYSYYLNGSKELIVGLDPNVDKGKSVSQGRFYIAGVHSNNSKLRYLLFFIAKSKTQYQMENEISRWGIDIDTNLVMMDGSGSAQMKTKIKTLYADGIPAYRRLPNIITISKRLW